MDGEHEINNFVDPRSDPRIVELEQRLQRAQTAFAKLNKASRPGEPTFNLDTSTILLARLDALASMLVGAGVIDYVEFTGEHLTRECEQIERAYEAARELKRQASGVIVPPARRNGHGR